MKETKLREVYVPPQIECFLQASLLNMLSTFSSDVEDWNGIGTPLDGDWEYDQDLDDFLNGGTAGNDGY